MKWFLFFLGLVSAASAQTVVGPLQAQKNLSEIATNGSSAQSAARTNLGVGSAAGPYLPLTGGTVTGSTTFNVGYITPGTIYDAKAYGSCTWDATHDVGPCINAAYTAAASAGGGEIVLPAGNYGLATALSFQANGVSLRGQGVGNARDSAAPLVFTSVTKLTWIGAAGATMFAVSPPSTASRYAINVRGVVFNCAELADVCARFTHLSNSVIDIGVSEPRSIGAWFDTMPSGFSDAPGDQSNDIWIQARSTSATYSPTGILFDQGTNGNFNFSFNRVRYLFSWYAKGDGIVIAGSDNNVFDDIATFGDPTNKGGTPLVVANAAYTMKNGLTVKGQAYSSNINKALTSGVITGYQSGSTIVAGANVGTAAVATVTLTTTSSSNLLSTVLNFSSGTTGVLSGMVMNAGSNPGVCVAWSCGIAPNTPVYNVSSTAVGALSQLVRTVASGQPVVFSYGIKSSAVSGTYTMTAVDGTHWSLTAPAGGNSQTNIAVASNAISFTDMVIPLSGTPTAGDTFVITVPIPVTNFLIQNQDKANSQPNFMAEPGSNIWNTSTTSPYPVPVHGTGIISMVPSVDCDICSVDIGGVTGGPIPIYGGVRIGGVGNSITGYAASAIGGHNVISSGVYASGGGDNSLSNAYTSRVFGSQGTARAQIGADCWGGGALAIQGDAQKCDFVLSGTGASASAFRLTADHGAASATNCINIPNNTAFALTVTIVALDHTAVANNETWLTWGGLLTRGANAASTALTMATKPTPLTNGTVAGSDVTATADTTNGCLSLTFTPPTANTNTWNTVARVATVEVQ